MKNEKLKTILLYVVCILLIIGLAYVSYIYYTVASH